MTIQEALKYDDGQIDPDAYSAGTVNGAWVSVADFQEAAAILMVGAMGVNATLDAKLQQAQDTAGAGAKDVPASAITQLTEAGGDGDEIVTLPARSAGLDITNAFTHVRIQVTTAVAAVDYGAVMVRGGAARQPQTNT